MSVRIADRYLIERVLGEGRLAVVFEVTDLERRAPRRALAVLRGATDAVRARLAADANAGTSAAPKTGSASSTSGAPPSARADA